MLRAIQSMISLEGLVIILLLGALTLYVRFIRARVKARDAAATLRKDEGMTDTELERYARHIVLREIGGQGQNRLRSAKVLVIGAGGLGAPVLSYLAAAGVGTIGIIDEDEVSLSNLQRQVIYDENHLDIPKVFAAEKVLNAQNPFVKIQPYHRKFTGEIADDLIADFDVVIDTSDSFETRELANAACVKQQKPMVFGAIAQWEGQVSVFDAREGGCFTCLFPKEPDAGLAPSCADAGVVGALPGVIGSMMAVEAIKLIAKTGNPLYGMLMIYDALYAENRTMNYKKRKSCPVCGKLK